VDGCFTLVFLVPSFCRLGSLLFFLNDVSNVDADFDAKVSPFHSLWSR
jgi:hypothetical protein